MADSSLGVNYDASSNPPKNDEQQAMEVEETILRPLPSYENLPKLEEADTIYKELMLALPKELWGQTPIRKYQGFWQAEAYVPSILAMQEAFKPRSSDVIVVSFPKSGTTWFKALTFTLVHRKKFDFSSHPLLKLSPHDCVPFIEYHYAMQDEHYLETLPSPRVLGTHVQYSMLPESIKTSHCLVVYICREPKDVLVSRWHMELKLRGMTSDSFSITQAFQLFSEGRVVYGPIWDHVFEYYTESLQNPNKILILKYEELMKDPIDGVMRVANFIGCPFSEEEVKTGVVEEVVELCSFKKLRDLQVNKNGIGKVRNDYFFRKGTVGDWQNHLTAEMAAKLDKTTKEKLLDFGLTF